jgi:hypothetical protein
VRTQVLIAQKLIDQFEQYIAGSIFLEDGFNLVLDATNFCNFYWPDILKRSGNTASPPKDQSNGWIPLISPRVLQLQGWLFDYDTFANDFINDVETMIKTGELPQRK